MKVKFVDYDIEHKGFWNYGFRYWLTEELHSENGKRQSKVILTTNEFTEILDKLQQFTSQGINIEFEENESFKQHQSELIQFSQYTQRNKF